MFDHLDGPGFGGPPQDARARVRSRVNTIRRKRWVVAASVAACLALGIVTVAAGITGSDEIRTVEPITSEAPSASADASEASSPSPSGSPSDSANAVPGPMAEPTAVAATDATATAVAEEPSASAVAPSASGPAPLSARVTLEPADVTTYQETTLKVTMEYPPETDIVERIDFGDGRVREPSYKVGNPPCPRKAVDEYSNAGIWAVPHAWRHPGTYTVVATLSRARCDGSHTRETKQVALRVTVRPGRISSNGPADLWAAHRRASPRPGDSALTVRLAGSGRDRDGHMRDIVIDWGDADSSTFTNPYPCSDSGGRRYPDAWVSIDVDGAHTYKAAGTYTISVRSTSTGCDGRDADTRTETLTVTVPPEPVTSESARLGL